MRRLHWTLVAAALVSLSLVACGDRGRQDQPDALNSLLRGELSAVETYRQVMEKIGSEPGATELARIHEEHKAAVERLRGMITQKGGSPSTDSKVWGDFAKAVTGTAKVFGNDAALRALKAGEEHGANDYEEALGNDKIDESFRATIRAELLPKQREHIRTIENLMKTE